MRSNFTQTVKSRGADSILPLGARERGICSIETDVTWMKVDNSITTNPVAPLKAQHSPGLTLG
jgi:hypothetical protein